MGRSTKIPWTDATWNWCIGCDKVSEGCLNCYAEAWAKRTGNSFKIHRASHATFIAPTRWHDPKVIFPCSLSDFLHPGADEYRADAWSVIRQTPQHTYLILTKRPERFEEVLAKVDGWPLPNVWLGVTVENQEMADKRIPLLFGDRFGTNGRSSMAVGHFLSMEPLLGAVKLKPHMLGIDWVIVGGESGPKARPMSHWSVLRILDDCAEWEVPVFVKQMSQREGRGFKDPATWPAVLRVQETPEALNAL